MPNPMNTSITSAHDVYRSLGEEEVIEAKKDLPYPVKALILAGGFGTRLKPVLGDEIPKPMALFAGKPFLEHQIRFLRDQGVTEIVLAVHHLSDKIKSYFGDGRRWNTDITYSEEETPLGTGGAIKNAEKYLGGGPFLVLNGDSYSHINIRKLLNFHSSHEHQFTISLFKTSESLHYGNVVLEGNIISQFSEKEGVGTGIVNRGIYVLDSRIFQYIASGSKISLEKEIFPILARERNLFGYLEDGYFMDIGRPETHEKFKEDVLNTLILQEHAIVREAMQKISKSGINILLVTDSEKKLKGIINDRIIKEFILRGGNIADQVAHAMVVNPITAQHTDSEEKRTSIMSVGIRHLPIVDEKGIIKDIVFGTELLKRETFPIISGKSPLRISFGGGGTDLPYFFGTYGGAVINATIDKYCHATIVKRADKKIIIDSDLTRGRDIVARSAEALLYDGTLDMVKAAIKVMKPDFGFEIYLHNDIPPGRGLGSSASLAVLVISLLNHLQETSYDSYKIAELAYKAHFEELKIKGGWQDQYAAVTGGFNFIEFNEEKNIIYPLRLKEEVIQELNHRLVLCYVGTSHVSSDVHSRQEENFKSNTDDTVALLQKMKKIAIEAKDFLLTHRLDLFGKTLHESWETKKKISPLASTARVNMLYELGMGNGAEGGRLLGAGNGGYLLFFTALKRRNALVHVLEQAGAEIMPFHFELGGTQIWQNRHKT